MVSSLRDTQERADLAALLEQNREGLLTCVHCGLCLPSCPTYRVLGNENDSPRGRLYLMRGVMENRLEPGHAFTSHIDRCLGCRACETVCPSGVPYGQVLEAARAEVAAIHETRKSPTALLTRFILNQIFSRPRLLASLMAGARWLRDSGIARMALDAALVKGRLRFALALLLSTRSRHVVAGAARHEAQTAGPLGQSQNTVRVALLRGCVMEGLFAYTNSATERVLERNRCE